MADMTRKGMDSQVAAVEGEGLTTKTGQNPAVVWCDGCYDMTHFGHANSLRQAKAMATYLIVGIHSDEEVTQQKAPPVFTQDERFEMIRGIKWVDEVVANAPFKTVPATLDKYHCHFTAHGNDQSTSQDGVDTYQTVKAVNRYKEYERTHGVSTTDLINRVLKATQTQSETPKSDECTGTDSLGVSPWTGTSEFLATTRKLQWFTDGKEPPVDGKIVYASGSFDILHPGHLAFLEAAKALGDYLIVGIHTDSVVNKIKGSIYPVSSLHERVLAVLACRCVDEVAIGAPYVVTKELIDQFGIKVVAHGKTPVQPDPNSDVDPYFEPKKEGIYKEIDSGSTLTTEDIVKRIVNNRRVYEARNAKKEKKEQAIFEARRSDL